MLFSLLGCSSKSHSWDSSGLRRHPHPTCPWGAPPGGGPPGQGQGHSRVSGTGKVLAAPTRYKAASPRGLCCANHAPGHDTPLLNTQMVPSPPTTLPHQVPETSCHQVRPNRRATSRRNSMGTSCPSQSTEESHFTDEETKAQRGRETCLNHTVRQSWDLDSALRSSKATSEFWTASHLLLAST